LIPLAFGFEEGVESERRWLRPMTLRYGLLGLRDIGLSYSVGAGGFFSDWTLHNGESGEDRDREIWMTARWEYRLRTDRMLWRWGLSGQVGRTNPSSTDPVGIVPGGAPQVGLELDPTQAAQIKYGGVHISSDWLIGGSRGSKDDRRFGFTLEALAGEIAQALSTGRVRYARADIEWEPWSSWGFLLRGEILDPDTQASGDILHEASFGVQHYVLPGALKRSLRAILVGTKEWSEGGSQAHHRVEFSLRFSPELPY
jgi:hypothetical protein